MAAKVVFLVVALWRPALKQRSFLRLAAKWPSSAVALWRPALKQRRYLRSRGQLNSTVQFTCEEYSFELTHQSQLEQMTTEEHRAAYL
jgi:hypothetical protein